MKNKYRYGIELESFVADNKARELMNRIQDVGFTSSGDPSIHPASYYYTGIEMKCAKPMGYERLVKSVKAVGKLCDEYEVKTNRSCGYHLHMSNKKFFNKVYVSRITNLWIAIEDVLIATQPAARFDNPYCLRKLRGVITNKQTLPQKKDELIQLLGRQTRYYTINFTALGRHGSIEIRLHAGTVNTDAILNWVQLMRAVYDYALSKEYDKDKVNKLFETPISKDKVEEVFQLINLSYPVGKYYHKIMHKRLYHKLARQQIASVTLLKTEPKIRSLTQQLSRLELKIQALKNTARESRETLSL